MILYHVSPTANDKSIEVLGLLTNRSKGKRRLIWLTNEAGISHAKAHVTRQKSVSIEQVTVWRVNVPDLWVKRTRWTGWYTCSNDLCPKRIKRH